MQLIVENFSTLIVMIGFQISPWLGNFFNESFNKRILYSLNFCSLFIVVQTSERQVKFWIVVVMMMQRRGDLVKCIPCSSRNFSLVVTHTHTISTHKVVVNQTCFFLIRQHLGFKRGLTDIPFSPHSQLRFSPKCPTQPN